MPSKKLIMPIKMSSQGYVQIYLPDHHRADPSGYVYEHIVVAEKKIGRPILFKNEAVHHIDRDKRNNDPANLMVLSHSEHGKIHGRDQMGRKKKKWFRNVSSGREKDTRYEPLSKEKLPRGHYYMRTLKNKRKTEKNKENA